MKRQDIIEQLSNIQSNIEATERRIYTIKTSEYYHMFGRGYQQNRDIHIQQKCLAYWKRRFNRVAFGLMYNL